MGGFISEPHVQVVYRDRIIEKPVIKEIIKTRVVKAECGNRHLSPSAKIHKTAAQAHKALRYHPNLEFIEPPDWWTPEDIALWVIENLARFISPPKIDGEDEEFSCEDIAKAIREKVGPELIEMMKNLKGRYRLPARATGVRKIDLD